MKFLQKFSFFLILLIVYIVFYLLKSNFDDAIGEIMYLLPPAFATITGYLLFKMYGIKNSTGNVIFLLFFGTAAWFVGELLWAIYQSVLEIDPYPSAADVFYLLAYPILFYGLYRKYQDEKEDKHILTMPVVVTTIVIGLLASIFFSYYSIYLSYDPEGALLENIVAVLYGVGDIILIVASFFAFILVKKYKGGKYSIFWKYFIFGIILTLIADILFAVYFEGYETSKKPYIYIDLFWIAGYLSIGQAFLHNFISLRETKKRIAKR